MLISSLVALKNWANEWFATVPLPSILCCTVPKINLIHQLVCQPLVTTICVGRHFPFGKTKQKQKRNKENCNASVTPESSLVTLEIKPQIFPWQCLCTEMDWRIELSTVREKILTRIEQDGTVPAGHTFFYKHKITDGKLHVGSLGPGDLVTMWL